MKIVDRDLHRLLQQKYSMDQADKATTKARKEITEKALPEVNIFLQDAGVDETLIVLHPESQGRGYQAKLSNRTRKTLNRELLLEAGISPVVLDACLKESAYTELRVDLFEG